MAFQTGTATDHDDLLNIIRVFAVAQGWTQNGWSVVGSGHRLHLEKSGQFDDFEKVDKDTVKFTLTLNPRTEKHFDYVLTTRHGTRTQ